MPAMKTISPIIPWLHTYKRGYITWDLIAGITLAAFVLPESMAYATLAGLPPQTGIYCCLVGGLLFAFFTSSRQLVVGPTSAISLMVGTTIATMAAGDPSQKLMIASFTALLIFAFSLIAYSLKLSSLVNFIGDNILAGFKTGAALSIASTQLPKLFGFHAVGYNFFERIFNLIREVPQTNMIILLFGLTSFGLLRILNRLIPGRPTILLVVIIAILVVTIWPGLTLSIHVVGLIPAGLPTFNMPSISLIEMEGIFGLALGCFIMGYIETISAARTLADKNGYEVNPRKELLSLSMANLATAFSSGFPVSGGLSQSTVNDKAGAKTPVALVVCSLALAILLLHFTSLLQNLPEVLLAVIVLDAIIGLVKIKELKQIYRLSKAEFLVSFIAICGVLIFGILNGVMIAAASSLIILLIRASTPKIAILGRIPGTQLFSDIERHPDNDRIEGCLIVRIETSVFYFNQQNIYNRILELIQESTRPLKVIIIDMSSSPRVDVAGSKMLVKLSKSLQDLGLQLRLVDALSDVRDILRLQGMEQYTGHISRKVSILDVVNEFEPHA